MLAALEPGRDCPAGPIAPERIGDMLRKRKLGHPDHLGAVRRRRAVGHELQPAPEHGRVHDRVVERGAELVARPVVAVALGLRAERPKLEVQMGRIRETRFYGVEAAQLGARGDLVSRAHAQASRVGRAQSGTQSGCQAYRHRRSEECAATRPKSLSAVSIVSR